MNQVFVVATVTSTTVVVCTGSAMTAGSYTTGTIVASTAHFGSLDVVLQFFANKLPESVAVHINVHNLSSNAFWYLRVVDLCARPHVVLARTAAGCAVIFVADAIGMENPNYVAVPVAFAQRVAENQAVKYVRARQERRARDEEETKEAKAATAGEDPQPVVGGREHQACGRGACPAGAVASRHQVYGG